MLDKTRDKVRHLGDVVGGVDQFGLFDIQSTRVFKKRVLILCRELLQRNTGLGGVADDFVVHVGNIHHVAYLVSALAEESTQDIYCYKCAEISDVAVVINRRPARIHADLIVLKRLELLDPSGKCIEQAK